MQGTPMAKQTTILARKVLRRAIALGGTTSKVILLTLVMSTACSPRYRETVVAAKEFPPLARARQMLEGYAAGDCVGSEFMGFNLLVEELLRENPAQAEAIGAALAEIEKSMLQPAEVQAIARRTLADLDAQISPAH
ncbi:MAG: hypothetical protein WCJ18_04015 [Planctomycetota bacterium]